MKNMLGDLLRRAVARPVAMPTEKQLEGMDAKAFTIRPSAELRVYLEKRAKQLGDLPLSNMVVMILSAFKDAEMQGEHSDYGQFDATLKRIAERVRYLYSAHSYSLIEAVKTLKEYSISPAIFLDDRKLVDHLSSKAYSELANTFCVREEWLTNPLKDSRMSERPTNRHNSHAILKEILEYAERRELERVIPFCSNKDLDGNRLIYSEGGAHVFVSIAVELKPTPKFNHNRIKVWSEIPFEYKNARIEFKALLMHLYEHFSDSTIFQGNALDPKAFTRVLSGRDIVLPNMLDGMRSPWDPEFYVGATWGDSLALETDEMRSVREYAENRLKLTE